MPDSLKIVFFGDIVGKPGRQGLAQVIPEIKKSFKPDLIIANVENSAHGKGVTENTLREIAAAGVDVFTSGEHVYDKVQGEEAAALFANFPTLIRPSNYGTDKPGRGDVIIETPKGKVLIVGLVGQVFFRQSDISPWTVLPEILQRQTEDLAAVVLDFHAEATSEKVALARYFDGQLSAVLGTHTHIPTADTKILPQGTAYITDVGMNGPEDSVLGMKSEVSIGRFLTGEMIPYEIAETPGVWINYVMIEIDPTTKKATKIEHKSQIINV